MKTNRYETLDGWRGLAALAIAFYHVPILHPFREWTGWKNLEFFVDFFFVLSGFVIAHAWGNRLLSVRDGVTFMQRRFWRVWPLHIIILGAFLLIECAKWFAMQKAGPALGEPAFSGPQSVPALLSNILMMQSLNLHGTTTWNGPAWSISVEFWTYLVFAIVMLIARGRLWVMVAVALLGAGIIALRSPIWLFATHDYGLARALYGFFAGVITFRLMKSWKAGPLTRPGTSMELAVLAFAGFWLAMTGKNASSMLAPLVFSAVVMVFSGGEGAVSRAIRSRPVQALGLWSYSVYLVHTLIYFALRFVFLALEKITGWPLVAGGSGSQRVFSFGNPLADGTMILLLLGLTVMVSALTYRFIEKPFLAESRTETRENTDESADHPAKLDFAMR